MRIIHYNANGSEFSGREFQYDAHHAHMIHELRARGHDVLALDPTSTLGRFGTPEEYEEITLKAVRDYQADGGCDLFFATAVDFSFRSETARAISAMGIPTVNLGMDDMSHPYRVREVTKGFDLVVTTDKRTSSIIRSYGARKLICQPFAANPFMFKPQNSERERAIYFIGACYGARARAIALLAQAGAPVRAFGSSPLDVYGQGRAGSPARRALTNYRDGWERLAKSLAYPAGRACVLAALKRSVIGKISDLPEHHPEKGDVSFSEGPPFDEFSTVLGRGALSLGSIELASTYVLAKPFLFVRFREFEAAMSGAAHVVGYVDELAECFEEDKEMIFHRGFEDLIDKTRFYLDPKQDANVQKIREAARARSEAEHTWTHRFTAYFDALGVKASL